MKRYGRLAFALPLICAVGIGATQAPASAAVRQAQAAAVSTYQQPHKDDNPLNPGHLLACAELLGLPRPQQLVKEVLRIGAVHFSLETLEEELAGRFLLAGEASYAVFDFWLNCAAPYLPVPAPPTLKVTTPTPPNPGGPPASSPPANSGIPTPPFYTLGGEAG